MSERGKESALKELTDFIADCGISAYCLDDGKGKVAIAFRQDFEVLCRRIGADPIMKGDGSLAAFKYHGCVVSCNVRRKKPADECY